MDSMAAKPNLAAIAPVPLDVAWLLPAVLSTTAGAVDMIGFLALGGLFAAHITGNLVVLASHYLTGGFSQIGPLLSVPVFIAVLGVVTVLSANKATRVNRRAWLILQAVLLVGFLGLGAWLGPFTNPDAATAVFSGMLGVAAMAIQNAVVRLALPGSPSTAAMTTNITQLAVDLATVVRGRGDPNELARARHRARLTFLSVAGFVAGCATGGFLEVHFGLRALALPVVLAVIAIPLGELWPDGATT
jgi:uncharacterized membrane protein YoaK (UPF0700 family)